MAKKKQTRQEAIKCVHVLPAACPKCGCTDRTAKACVISREITGEIANPLTVEHERPRANICYTRVQWSYANCKGCGERYRFIEYLKPVYRSGDKT